MAVKMTRGHKITPSFLMHTNQIRQGTCPPTRQELIPTKRISRRDFKARKKILRKKRELVEIISEEIKSSLTKSQEEENIRRWDEKIASDEELLNDTYNTIRKSTLMFTDEKLKRAFSIRATEGHASEGHGIFKKIIEKKIPRTKRKKTIYIPNPYENTTTHRVLEAIEREEGPLSSDFSKRGFMEISQAYINQIVLFFERWLKEIEKNISSSKDFPKSITFPNNRRKTMHSMPCYKGMQIDMLEALRTFYLTTMMDSLDATRNMGGEKYGYHLGGGEGHLANTEEMKRYGLGIRDLAKMNNVGLFKKLEGLPHKSKLEILEKLKIIERKTLPLEDIAQGEYTWEKILSHKAATNLIDNQGKEEVYIRELIGQGVGDDIVIVLGGFIPKTLYRERHTLSPIAVQSRIIGGLWGDGIDTHCKTSKIFLPGGQDYIAGLHLNGVFKRLAKDPRFREAFNIKKREDKNYNLLEREELVDFTMAGANTKEQHLHSSQRYFYREIPEDKKAKIPRTCTITQYMTYAAHCAIADNIPIDTANMRGFKVDLAKPLTEQKITFERIPFRKARETLKERLDLVRDPSKREKNLREFFSKQQESYQSTPS